ncbi:MAG: hypothetical protein ACK4RK_20255 [Gemmataceae bacterium]
MPAINRHVEHGDVNQWIIGRSAVLDEPACELLDGPQVVVAGLDALALLTQIGQVRLNSACRDVADECGTASFDDSSGSRGNQLDLLVANVLGLEMPLEVVQVVAYGPLAVLLESIHEPSHSPLNLVDKLVEHGLGGGLVHGQGNAALDAVLVAVAAPPLLRLRLDLLPGFRVGHVDRLLVKTCHSCSPHRTIFDHDHPYSFSGTPQGNPPGRRRTSRTSSPSLSLNSAGSTAIRTALATPRRTRAENWLPSSPARSRSGIRTTSVLAKRRVNFAAKRQVFRPHANRPRP